MRMHGVRLAVVLVLATSPMACGGDEQPSCPSNLEIVNAANEDFGMRLDPEEDFDSLIDYEERVTWAWCDNRSEFTVSRNGWVARVQSAEEPLQPGEWIVTEATVIMDISDNLGNETFLRTVRIVARMLPEPPPDAP